MKTVICRGIHGETEQVPLGELTWRPSIYGIIIKDGSVLLSRQWDGYDFPGGSIDIGETLGEAFTREVREETGMHAERDTLVHVHEDFFIHPMHQKKFQTILLYYTGTNVHGTISTDDFDEYEKKYAQEAQWVPLEQIESLKFYNPVDSVALIKKAVKMR